MARVTRYEWTYTCDKCSHVEVRRTDSTAKDTTDNWPEGWCWIAKRGGKLVWGSDVACPPCAAKMVPSGTQSVEEPRRVLALVPDCA